jgi:hypothetical protein
MSLDSETAARMKEAVAWLKRCSVRSSLEIEEVWLEFDAWLRSGAAATKATPKVIALLARFPTARGLVDLRTLALLLLRQLALLVNSRTRVLIRRKHRRLINRQDLSHDYTHFPKHEQFRLILLILQRKQTLGIAVNHG